VWIRAGRTGVRSVSADVLAGEVGRLTAPDRIFDAVAQVVA